MDSSLIEKFLQRIVKRRSRVYALTGFYLALASLAGGYLAGNLIGYFYAQPRAIAVPFLLLWCLPVFYVLVRYFLRGAFSHFTLDHAALLAEKKIHGLNNSLISSVQLRRRLAEPDKAKSYSASFIKELTQRTEAKIKGIKTDSLVNGDSVKRGRNIFVGVLGLLLTATLALPDFITKGHGSWSDTAALTNLGAPSIGPNNSHGPISPSQLNSIEGLTLTFNYPAYTGLKSVTVQDPEGKAQVMPGTEVVVKGKTKRPVSGAELLLNGRDEFIMTVKEGRNFLGQFIAREEGYYQLRLRPPDADKVLLPTRRPIILDKDQPPRVTIFLANPKPQYFMSDKVQFFYESFDDFGVSAITLVINTNGVIRSRTLKTAKHAPKELKGQLKWELAAAGFNPGDKILYYLEARDNDNVNGPNIGQSEIFSFEIFDEGKKRRDLLELQDELLGEMVDLLAENLVVKLPDPNGSPQERMRLKKVLASSADQLITIIAIAKSIRGQALTVESFPKAYITLLENIISGFRKIRNEQIRALDYISAEIIKTSAVGRNFPPVTEMNSNLVSRLETNIIFLIKIIARERMEQVRTMENDIAKLTNSLRDAFEKIKNKEARFDGAKFQSVIDKIKETLQKIMDQLSRQNLAMPDEFLNPNSFEKINIDNLSASLEKMQDLLKKGMVDEAMKQMQQLTEDLNALSRQLDDAAENMGDMVDMDLMKKLDDSLRKIIELEKGQKAILRDTTAINKSLREKQFMEFAGKLQTLFELLRKDVAQIQAVLKEDDRYLQEHQAMRDYNGLVERETKISRQLRNLSQRTMDLTGDEKASRLFIQLNEARDRLSQVNSQMVFIRMKVFNEFHESLPKLFEKYDQLAEMATIQDLNEFNTVFKNTYPEIYRWQNRFRGNRGTRADISGKLNADLKKIAELNSSISRKLGTVLRDLSQNFKGLIGQQNKKLLETMAGKQNNLSQEAQEVSGQFMEMSRENPMITPRLASKMTATWKYMQHARKNLNQHKVAESIEAENKSLAELEETRELLEQMKSQNSDETKPGAQKKIARLGLGRAKDNRRGGSARMKKEYVDLPAEGQNKASGQFRKDILEAMKNRYPKKYERLVMEYYKELVK